jgi:hypothetical protein
VRNGTDGGDVEHVQARVTDGFAKEQLGVRSHGGAPAVDVARLHESGLDAEASQGVVQQVLRAAIEGRAGHDVRSGAHERGNRQVQRRLAAGGGDRADAAFQRRHALLEHRVGGVADAAVDVAGALQVEQGRRVVAGLEDERGGQVNRHGASAGGGVRGGTGVQRQGVEAGVGIAGHAGLQKVLWWRMCFLGQLWAIFFRRHATAATQEITMKVSGILRVKGNTLFTVTPDEPLARAVDIMAEKDIGSLVVMEHGELVGMLTFRRSHPVHREERRHAGHHTGSLVDGRPPADLHHGDRD